MHRKRSKKNQIDINLDSLMDILTCTVGIMLFVFIFTLLETGGAVFEMRLPRLKTPPQNLNRELFICTDGKIKYAPINKAVENSLYKIMGEKKVTYANLPDILNLANRLKYEDKYFSYRYEVVEQSDGFFSRRRLIKLIISLRENIDGEDSKSINNKTSYFGGIVKSLNKNNSWITFLVDNKSLEVFKTARKMFSEKEVEVGWEPVEDNFFPHEEIIGLGNGDSNQGYPQ